MPADAHFQAADVRIVRATFKNFKALKQFEVHFHNLTVLVGPNNSGKSTIIAALRVLSAGLRRGRAKSVEPIDGPSGRCFGYVLPPDQLPMSVENVHTDYAKTDTSVTFHLSNGNSLELDFPADGGCNLIPHSVHKHISAPSTFRSEFPVTIAVVPVLGPVEHHEKRLRAETVTQALATHRASRHFRNYWHHFAEGFEEFADTLARTWPGMTIDKPFLAGELGEELAMFAYEDRIARELYWCGFGFQIWCQLLTHVSRCSDETMLVIDEPEVYLHPDLQRQLIGILRSKAPDVVVATHSTEVMSEADPSELFAVDKHKRRANRLNDVASVQAMIETVGSVQNITLARLARNNHVLFVEDESDFALIRRFASRLGCSDLSTGIGITPVKSEGFTSWQRILALKWGMQKLDATVQVGAIYDRDFHCDEEIESIVGKLEATLDFVKILERKEIENYLLIPSGLNRALEKAIRERSNRTGDPAPEVPDVRELLEELSEPLRETALSQYIARRTEHLKSSGRDAATITAETLRWFNGKWSDFDARMEIVPGKELVRELRTKLRENYAVTLTDNQIVTSFRKGEIPAEVVALVKALDAYRKDQPDDPTSELD